ACSARATEAEPTRFVARRSTRRATSRLTPSVFPATAVFTMLAVDKEGLHGDDGGTGPDDLAPPPRGARVVVLAHDRGPQAHRGDVRVRRLHVLSDRRHRGPPPPHPPRACELRVPDRRRLQRPLHHAWHDDDLPRRDAAVVCVHELPAAAPTRRPRRGV